MPRVTNPPRSRNGVAPSPHKQSPIKIPLNDDRQEKAVRLQSRQALHDLQINQLKAAASPMRKFGNYDIATSNSPKTPRGSQKLGKEAMEDQAILAMVGGSAVTPMKRMPILANFEEWMKMATDNKINATNSWNFALIDYFHDMSLLKEGDGVNFQKASCTLDGCVKIYTSRVDSVATETGKLLSGLADSGNKKTTSSEGEDERGTLGGEEEDEFEDGIRKRSKRRAQRSSEATLASSFAQLQLRKFELEFSVDPMFKKASADFDEGGAKGLLLNHLTIDSHGRVVFDSNGCTENQESTEEKSELDRDLLENTPRDPKENRLDHSSDNDEDDEIDLSALCMDFFPSLNGLDDKDICPSLKSFDSGDSAGISNIPFLKAPEDTRPEENAPVGISCNRSGILLDEDNAAGFEDDDGVFTGLEIPTDAGFGEGGEAWIRNAGAEPRSASVIQGDLIEGPMDGAEIGNRKFATFDATGGQHVVSINHSCNDNRDDILSYFDTALKKNWAGPEHWRIRRMKDTKASVTVHAKRKEKEPFHIDFSLPLDPGLAELIYTPASSNSIISIPKTQWKSKTRNLLPDDKHFNSRQLLQLFLKPKARIGIERAASSHRGARPHDQRGLALNGEMDEAFWAGQGKAESRLDGEDCGRQADYDANFFQDDVIAFPEGPLEDDEDEFMDARAAFSPSMQCDLNSEVPETEAREDGGQEGAFGTRILAQNKRVRPEYVQYARVAKKVDVRRLKEELWRGIGFEETAEVITPAKPVQFPSESNEDGGLKFTSIMNGLQQVYPKQAMADISTSFCFICLLHLANEKGLALSSEEGLNELGICKDLDAFVADGAE